MIGSIGPKRFDSFIEESWLSDFGGFNGGNSENGFSSSFQSLVVVVPWVDGSILSASTDSAVEVAVKIVVLSVEDVLVVVVDVDVVVVVVEVVVVDVDVVVVVVDVVEVVVDVVVVVVGVIVVDVDVAVVVVFACSSFMVDVGIADVDTSTVEKVCLFKLLTLVSLKSDEILDPSDPTSDTKSSELSKEVSTDDPSNGSAELDFEELSSAVGFRGMSSPSSESSGLLPTTSKLSAWVSSVSSTLSIDESSTASELSTEESSPAPIPSSTSPLVPSSFVPSSVVPSSPTPSRFSPEESFVSF